MKAEIFSIGTEILLGDILDTNTHYIATRLPALGIDLYFSHQVGDNLDRLAGAIELAWERSDLIICTGGLGPTEDDVTRDAIARVLGETPAVDPRLEDELRGWFAGRGYPMPERNIKQAWLTPSTRTIPNPRGTAPGWWAEKDGRIIIAMPGPPAEMSRMWDKEVSPGLVGRSGQAVIVSHTVKTVGIGEGNVDEMVSHLLKGTNPSIGVYSKADGIHLRLTAKAATTHEAEGLIAPVMNEVEEILGTAVWGHDDDTLEGATGRMLKERGLTLTTMESATAGLLASTITDAPGSSGYYRGGLIAYATEQKIAWGVDPSIVHEHGVISPECARDMARAARAMLGTDLALSVTGVAGPDTQEGKPVGTMHVGLDFRGESHVVSYQFAQGRDAAKRRAVTVALQLLRRVVMGQAG